MQSTTNRHDLEQMGPGWPSTTRPVVYATRGVVSSGHYLTSMAGMRMLLSGGNAFDAVVASAFAAAVVEPIASYSLGAEGVFMLYDADSRDLLALSGQGTAPSGATVDFYRSQGLDAIPTGPGPQAHLSFTLPGIVHALSALLERYGTKTLAEALEPSVRYAKDGIPNYEYMLERIGSEATRRQFDLYPPGGSEVFYANGAVPAPGSLLVQRALGETLAKMAAAEERAVGSREERIRAGRDAFYLGEVAETIVECSRRVGRVVSREDLAGYSSKFDTPAMGTFMGREIYGQPTWTQAPVLIQTLNILEHFDLRSMGHNTPAYVHTVIEALKLAMADREAHYGDPEFSTIPIDGLVSKEYAAERAGMIDAARAHPELPAAGDPWRFSRRNGSPSPQPEAVPTVGGGVDGDGGTTHISALDDRGNMVCATPSGGAFGSSVFFPEVGCTLSTRSEMFNFTEGHPNVLVPGKRPRTTLINYIVAEGGRPTMTVGCPGGDMQAQANVQLMLNTMVFGMNPQEAIEAPRFGTLSVPNSFYPHEYYPGRLALEPGFPDATAAALREQGHEVVRSENCGMGATVSRRDPDTGVLSTGGDPRRACYAIGW